MPRPARRIVWFVLMLAAAWYTMVLTHEFGHICCGWLSGGTLAAADLRPWALPWRRFKPDPHPLVTLWGGPVLGVVVPWAAASLTRHREMWFVSHFCTLANGVYLALAWLTGDRWLDTARLLDEGASSVAVGIYCLTTICCGYVGFRRACMRLLASEPPHHSNIANSGA